MNYLFLLPNELVNIIFEKCTHDSLHDSIHDNYIKFQYNIHHKPYIITRKYSEYTGIIQNGIPTKPHEIIQGTAYLDHIPEQFNNKLLNWYLVHDSVQVIETKWLYKPLLYVLKNYELTYMIVKNLETN